MLLHSGPQLLKNFEVDFMLGIHTVIHYSKHPLHIMHLSRYSLSWQLIWCGERENAGLSKALYFQSFGECEHLCIEARTLRQRQNHASDSINANSPANSTNYPNLSIVSSDSNFFFCFNCFGDCSANTSIDSECMRMSCSHLTLNLSLNVCT